EDDHVVLLTPGEVERLLAVEGEIDRHPFATEPDRDRRGELSVVFDNQDAHCGPGSAAPQRTLPGHQRMPHRGLHADNGARSRAVICPAVSVTPWNGASN